MFLTKEEVNLKSVPPYILKIHFVGKKFSGLFFMTLLANELNLLVDYSDLMKDSSVFLSF